MTGPKTNERPGTRAVLRHAQISPFKVRPILDLIRGEHVEHAVEILRFSERDASIPIRKLLLSAVANAATNDGLDPDELYVSACFADEGSSLRRFRYRARGRATRILKRRSHITIVVSRLGAEELTRYRERRSAEQAALRTRRVEAGRRGRRRPPDDVDAEVEEEAADDVAEVEEETVDDVAEVQEEAAEDVLEDADDVAVEVTVVTSEDTEAADEADDEEEKDS
jgi:large subunit ribosomal protein L22